LFREPDVGGISVSAHQVNDSERHPLERFGWTESTGFGVIRCAEPVGIAGTVRGGFGRYLTIYIETRSMRLFGAGASIQFKLKVVLR
jgi:hypothetical protein